MNSIALNQTLFKKSAIIGKGFEGGNKNSANKTPRGYYVWINGVHNMPEADEISDISELGLIEHPSLMFGMGDGSGEIKYWLGATESEYVLLVGVKLNSSLDDSDDYAIDIATLVFKDRVPIAKSNNAKNL